MIPRRDVQVDPTIREHHGYWVPTEEDLESEDGFGGFRDTTPLQATILEARAVVREERELIEVADRVARDAREFEAIANAFEWYDRDELPEGLRSGPQFALLDPHISDNPPIGGLELGVAGLSHALAAVGCFPAASCRSHDADVTWSERPVVYVGADPDRAAVLERLVRQAGCGFGFDPDHPQLPIEAPSIRETARLADLVLENEQAFASAGQSEGL